MGERSNGIVRIFKNAWFERFARKHHIPDKALLDAVDRVEKGQIDADLGGGVLKQRIARKGQGQSFALSFCAVRLNELSSFTVSRRTTVTT